MVASEYLVISETPSLIVIAELTNFQIYTILIWLETVELATASGS